MSYPEAHMVPYPLLSLQSLSLAICPASEFWKERKEEPILTKHFFSRLFKILNMYSSTTVNNQISIDSVGCYD